MRGPSLALLLGCSLMLSGCVAAGVATVTAGAGLGATLGLERNQTAASVPPPASADFMEQPAVTNQPDPWNEPTPLVGSKAPVESVEIQPIQ